MDAEFLDFHRLEGALIVEEASPTLEIDPHQRKDRIREEFVQLLGLAEENIIDQINPFTLLVGGTDTSCRHWSPTSPFPVPHSSEPRPGSLEVPGMGLRPCGPQCVVSLARLRPVRGRQTRVRHVTGLTGLDETFCHSCYQSKVVVMVDRRDWGGGGDDPEESTQRMIERIWESLTDIRMRMD
ncbi:hypothetical protein Taro_042992 [Colocasia esculenta]|uniref:Uncharacterized protein n=1 Tax=Colocasia esculenta TaxID=4460 RepID=A0A843WFA0_COLES|nr:hypothetical protein [Colocasia esculenta]